MNTKLSLSDVFPTTYLKASDLNDAGLILTINNYNLVTFGSGNQTEKKLALTFVETGKVFVVNKTNGRIIARLYGDQIDSWIGKAIELYPEQVSFQGQPMMGVRVKMRVPNPPAPIQP